MVWGGRQSWDVRLTSIREGKSTHLGITRLETRWGSVYGSSPVIPRYAQALLRLLCWASLRSGDPPLL